MPPRCINYVNPAWVDSTFVERYKNLKNDLQQNTKRIHPERQKILAQVKGLRKALYVLSKDLYGAKNPYKAEGIRHAIRHVLNQGNHKIDDFEAMPKNNNRKPIKRNIDIWENLRHKGFTHTYTHNGVTTLYRQSVSRVQAAKLNRAARVYRDDAIQMEAETDDLVIPPRPNKRNDFGKAGKSTKVADNTTKQKQVKHSFAVAGRMHKVETDSETMISITTHFETLEKIEGCQEKNKHPIPKGNGSKQNEANRTCYKKPNPITTNINADFENYKPSEEQIVKAAGFLMLNNAEKKAAYKHFTKKERYQHKCVMASSYLLIKQIIDTKKENDEKGKVNLKQVEETANEDSEDDTDEEEICHLKLGEHYARWPARTNYVKRETSITIFDFSDDWHNPMFDRVYHILENKHSGEMAQTGDWKPSKTNYADLFLDHCPPRITTKIYLRTNDNQKLWFDVDQSISIYDGSRDRDFCVPAFIYDGYIPSGTPIWNENGLICSYITQSYDNLVYGVSCGKSQQMKVSGKTYWSNTMNSGQQFRCAATDESERIRSQYYHKENCKFITIGNQMVLENDHDSLVVIHCNPTKDLSKTHHNYVDLFAKKLLYYPASLSHVEVEGVEYTLSKNMLVNWSYACDMFQVAEQPTIHIDKNLQCGTPVWFENKLVTVITKSDGNGNYVLTKFGNNTTFTVGQAKTDIKRPNSPYIYGSFCFTSKEELVAHINNHNGGPSNTVTVWQLDNSTQVTLDQQGKEMVRVRIQNKLASKLHSVTSKTNVSRSIEINKVAAELAYLNTRMANLTMHATNATNLDAKVQGGPTIKKKKRNKTRKQGIVKTLTDTVGITIITITLLLGLITGVVAPAAPAKDACVGFDSVAAQKMSLTELQKYNSCSPAVAPMIAAIKTANANKSKMPGKTASDNYVTATEKNRVMERCEEICKEECAGITDDRQMKPDMTLPLAKLSNRIDCLTMLADWYDTENVISATKAVKKQLESCITTAKHLDSISHLETLDNMTITECNEALTKLSVIEEDIFHMKFQSKQYSYAGQRSLKCNQTGWALTRYLLNGKGQSCQTGLDSAIERSGECRRSEENDCYSSAHDECSIGGNSVIEQTGKIISKSAIQRKQICCTLPCFSKEELYTSLTDQPFCSSCLSAYVGLLWHSDCLPNFNKEPTDVMDMRIYSYSTHFNIGGKEFSCRNIYSFSSCCNGKGAVSEGVEVDFVDKLCACRITSYSRIEKSMKSVQDSLESAMSSSKYLKCAIVVFGIFVFPRLTAGLLILAVSLWSVNGSCQLNDLVTMSNNAKSYNKDLSWPVRIRVNRGDCMDSGDYTAEVTSIKRVSQYKYLSSVPYKIKVICSGFNWGCQLGRGSTIEHEQDECEKMCKSGIFYKHIAIQSYFEGSACMILSGIHTKMTACFSAGNLGSEVKVFSRLSLNSEVILETIRHRQGVDLATEIKMDDDSPMLVSEPSSDNNIWPYVVAIRGGDRFCSYDMVDISKTCHSANLHDPLSIDPNCLNPVPHWSAEHKRYELSYKSNDFEDLVHVSFEKCPSDMEIDIVDYKLVVKMTANSLTATFQFKRFEDSSIQKCNSIPKVVVEKGTMGYHQSTIVKIRSTNTYKCYVHIVIEGCESTQGQLFMLIPKKELITDYWCANNSTGVIKITNNKGTHLVTKDVAKNILPHKQQLENLVASTYESAASTLSFSSLLGAFEGIDVVSIGNSVYDYFHLNIYKIVLTIFSLILVYRAVITFDVPLMIFAVAIGFLSTMTGVLACWPSIGSYWRIYRYGAISDVVINITSRTIEEAQNTALMVVPNNVADTVWIISVLTDLISCVSIALTFSLLVGMLAPFLYRVICSILTNVNLGRPKQDVIIAFPGVPIVGVVTFRSLVLTKTRLFLNKRKQTLGNIVKEISSPIYCSDGIITINMEKLVEGNNQLEGSYVYRKGDHWYAAAHSLSEEDQKACRIRYDVATNDLKCVIAAQDQQIFDDTLSVGDSGKVSEQPGNKLIIFLKIENNRRYGRLISLFPPPEPEKDTQTMPIHSANAYSSTFEIGESSTEPNPCTCLDGECYLEGCEKFVHSKNRDSRIISKPEVQYEDPYGRFYGVVQKDNKIGLLNTDLQATHVSNYKLYHKDGLDMSYNKLLKWYKGDLSIYLSI